MLIDWFLITKKKRLLLLCVASSICLALVGFYYTIDSQSLGKVSGPAYLQVLLLGLETFLLLEERGFTSWRPEIAHLAPLTKICLKPSESFDHL